MDNVWHGRGIGGELWRRGKAACIDAGGSGVFTLNASSYAKPVYEKWGFKVTGGAQDRQGVITTPMKLVGDSVE